MRFIGMFLILFLAGCSSPSLYVNDNKEIGIKVENESLSVAAKLGYFDTVNLGGVVIDRQLYTIKGAQHVVYEEARTMPPNLFNYEVKGTLDLAFDAKRVDRIQRKGNLGFYKIVFPDDTFVYAVAQNLNKRGIKMVYGLTAEQMTKLMKDAGIEEDTQIDATPKAMVLPDSEKAILSRWRPELIIVDSLLIRVGGKPVMK